MLELTPNDLITRPFRYAVKTAPVKIRPLTEADVASMGSSFLDLEQRSQCVEVGRFLCVGVNGEQWTCSQKSMVTRLAVSEKPDAKGFTLYVQREPVPLLVTLIDEPFVLVLPGDRWQSQRGAITWNGLYGEALRMRVVERSIFDQTYRFL